MNTTDRVIIEAVSKAAIILKVTFNLSQDESAEMIDVIYNKLIEIGERKLDEDRTNQRRN
jgi:hypothetical protein